jgi:phytoene synthase
MGLRVTDSWEYRLLAWAEEAMKTRTVGGGIETDKHLLDAAYRHCDAITRTHSRTFYMASSLLAPAKRRAVRALYAFCRVTDDLVDENDDHGHSILALDAWQHRITNNHPAATDPVGLAWADTRARFSIPTGYASQLIDGVRRDLSQTRYDTFDELAAYAYGVASTVGLMAMHIIGFDDETALPFAVRLGVALQITNILRDVGEDWRMGRLYLPREEMHDFGLTEADIANRKVTDRWRAFMRFQIARNRQLYAESRPGIALLEAGGRFAIAAAAGLYEGILTDIEAHDYDVFARRAHLGRVGKLARLPGIWLRSRRTGLR